MILIRLDLKIDHFVQVGSWTKEKSDLVFVADRSMDQLVVYRSLYRDILAENVANTNISILLGPATVHGVRIHYFC